MSDDQKLTEPQKPAEPKPAEPSQPSPEELLNRQASFYARDLKRGGEAFDKLLTQINELSGGLLDIKSTDAKPAPDVIAEMEQLKRENAKTKAALRYGLSEDDLELIDGTPAQIDERARRLAERLKTAGPKPPEPAPKEPGDGPTIDLGDLSITEPGEPMKPLPAYSGAAPIELSRVLGREARPAETKAYQDLVDSMRKHPVQIKTAL